MKKLLVGLLAGCMATASFAETTVLSMGFEGYTQTNTDVAVVGLETVFPAYGDVGFSYTLDNGVAWVGPNPEANGNTSSQVLSAGGGTINTSRSFMLFEGGAQPVNGMRISYDFYNEGNSSNGDEGVRMGFRNSGDTGSGFWLRNDRDGLIKLNGQNQEASNAGQDVWQHLEGTLIQTTGVGTYDFVWSITNLETGVEVASGVMSDQSPGVFSTGQSTGLASEMVDPNDAGGFIPNVDNITVTLLSDPLPPLSLSGSMTNLSEVALEWTTGLFADTYNVYRATTSGGYGTPLKTVVSELSYVDDTAVLGETYYYVVTSVVGGDESAFSTEFSIQTDIIPPGAPVNLAIATNMALFQLTWDKNIEPDLASYSVYRSTTSGSYGEPIAVGLTNNVYNTGAPTVGDTYYYAVTASDITGNENDVNESEEVFGAIANAESRLFFVLADGDIYGFNSIASNGWSTIDAQFVTNGTLLAHIPEYADYQAFANLPNREIYGVDAGGDVLHWSNVADFLSGPGTATTVASGTYAPEVGSTERIHGASYDPNTKGFYTTLESAVNPPDGDVALYSNVTAFINNTSYLTNESVYGGNVANFYYGGGDVPNNAAGSYTNVSGNLPYMQLPGSGGIEGWVTLDAYIALPENRSFQLAGFSGDRTVVGAFAVLPTITSVGDVTITPLSSTELELSWVAESLGTYAVQADGNLQLPPSWTNLVSDIEGIDGTLSVTTTVSGALSFYRVSGE